uniref:hypothetical protein n=1 Tax=Vibrio vulnificus TaxID=672 RepID=UPI001A915D5F
FMEFIDRPVGANQEEIYKLETIFQITLPESMLNWWSVSDGLRDPLIISPKRNHVRIDFEQAGLQLRASLPSLLCS